MQQKQPLLVTLRKMTGKFAASSVAAALLFWGMRRLLRRRQWAKAVSCQNMISSVSGLGVGVRNAVVSTMTSFVATPASNGTLSSGGVDESWEPRAEELELPLAIQSKVLRHISFHDVYSIGKEGSEEVLGTGMHGAVLVAKHRKSGRRVAAKCLESDSALPEEVSLYLRLSHPNVCRLLQAFVEKNGEIWLCMELCAGGELFELAAGTSSVKREGASMLDTEARIAVLVKQMAAAIRYIHSMGIVHRDIKLENWVFASPAQERLKLIDFGLATRVVGHSEGTRKKLTQMCGTCYYVAPEIIGLKNGTICKGDGYAQEVDVWALGVLIYMLVSGMPPFNGKSHADVIWNIANFKYCDDPMADAFLGPRWENVSPVCKDLIQRCMNRDPEKRLTAAGVQMHPWLCQVASAQLPLMSLEPVLKDLCFAGKRMSQCTALAHICGSLASTIYLSPESWTEYKDYFMALECLETLAPKGALSISKLVAAFEEVKAQTEKSPAKGPHAPDDLAGLDSFRAIGALDRTGDGRLHFFEFLGAMIAAGRIQIHDADVADVFAAFDVDRDDVISQKDMESIMKHDQEALQALNRPSNEKLGFPIDDRATLLEALNRKPEWAGERQSAPSPLAAVAQKPAEAAPHPTMQRLLSKAKLHMEWKVQRQVAYEDVRKAVKLKSLNRGWRTPDPSPTRDADAEKDNSGSALGSPRHRISKMAQSMVQLSDLDWRKGSHGERA